MAIVSDGPALPPSMCLFAAYPALRLMDVQEKRSHSSGTLRVSHMLIMRINGAASRLTGDMIMPLVV